MSPRNPFILGSKGHEANNKSVSVSRRNAISTLAAYVSYAGFSPRPMLLPTADFSVRGTLKHWRRGSWRSCECWLLLVMIAVTCKDVREPASSYYAGYTGHRLV